MTDAFTQSAPLKQPRSQALSGLSVLVTRPKHQAGSLVQLLEQAGARVLQQPTIAIEAACHDSQKPVIDALAQYNWLIFISKNAVEYGLALIAKHTQISAAQSIAAIGKATHLSLNQHGVGNVCSPDQGFNSEALLDSKAFSAAQINQQKILILRGGKGREHLKEVLESRGATVTYLDVYQRQAAPLLLRPDEFATLDIITVSSQQGLENLNSLLDTQTLEQIHDKLLITPAERCSQRARELGFIHVEAAANATDNAMLKCIIDNVSASCNNNDQKQ
ncbi:MAG: uroporphyrinogen-III synthase [Gammaproteobacteria bacterium]|nr:uroporphyrinogen-III synthase [Gammaproteobacteria bacterium]